MKSLVNNSKRPNLRVNNLKLGEAIKKSKEAKKVFVNQKKEIKQFSKDDNKNDRTRLI